MSITHAEAQELHEIIGTYRQLHIDSAAYNVASATRDLTRALEIAALIVSDTGPDNADPDWLDDAEDMRDADHVEIHWTARDARGRITFNSDDTITGAQAAAMFEAIGRTA